MSVTFAIDLICFGKSNFPVTGTWLYKVISLEIQFFLAGRLAQLVERRTREHNVSGHYRCGFESPAEPTKIINCLSDEMLNRGPV